MDGCGIYRVILNKHITKGVAFGLHSPACLQLSYGYDRASEE